MKLSLQLQQQQQQQQQQQYIDAYRKNHVNDHSPTTYCDSIKCSESVSGTTESKMQMIENEF